jgi:hypothetical protein
VLALQFWHATLRRAVHHVMIRMIPVIVISIYRFAAVNGNWSSFSPCADSNGNPVYCNGGTQSRAVFNCGLPCDLNEMLYSATIPLRQTEASHVQALLSNHAIQIRARAQVFVLPSSLLSFLHLFIAAAA